ncbi:PREDICTED: histone-lysine N-methyltransferase SETD1A-like isoform X1 [Camelina sativa]|uniref:Histone-lysine N-methyltransferase SETD1A-like isoform X1 n=1 Tax=Camelina sativa TaxID=90675 RepID=A0ABM0WHW6_CAMSA|nr:PREDICTED: histone-lysine N-methyltransferase SETD1A-like isoform X2 [Camelina sativa]XP_010471315.1 PREDICTED: histone-lysine N-methyltransferase SETD1A-like isoform X1 [Camelina sativa]
MEEEDGDASTPFWLQSRRNSNTYFRRTASLGGRATTVATQIFFAGAAAILIVFFIIPPFFSSVSQIFRPHLVRKSWDYLNFVLVLFAVLCGFLSRNSNNDETNHNKEEDVSNKFSNSPSIIDRGGATPRYWLDDRGDQTVYKRFSRLRSVSSYPDLRLREYEDDERWRFYDDTRVSKCRYEEDTDPIYPNQSYRNWQEEVKPPPEDVVQPDHDGSNGEGRKVQSDVSEAEKVEVVATAEAEVVEEELTVPSAPPYIPSPPRAPPQPKQAKRKTKRVYQDVPPKEDKKERDEFVAVATPPTTPIPPPTTVYQRSNKQEKKKGGATKEFLIALRRKKKKQRQQSIDGLDLLFGSDPPLVYTMPQPPPPPPPPPPFLQGLFSSKKGKNKRTNNSNPPPPPPPPPPERRYESRASIAKLRKAPVESRTSKPNPPARVTQFVGTGNESPLLPIPPPPPPPPFKMPAWKFVKRGDYVRMASDISISSDEPDESDVAQSAGGSMFCPSPDVDTKADDFIARFRAGLKLEKMNSAKRARSNLGPEPGLDESGS